LRQPAIGKTQALGALFGGDVDFLRRFFNYPPNTLDWEIALAYAKHYPIEAHYILAAKTILKSWDKIEALCEFTKASN